MIIMGYNPVKVPSNDHLVFLVLLLWDTMAKNWRRLRQNIPGRSRLVAVKFLNSLIQVFYQKGTPDLL